MEFEAILYDVSEGIATITLNRPEMMNAFDMIMFEEFMRVFDLTDADDEVGAVIITGAGRAFCAGADLSKGTETWEGYDEIVEEAKQGDGGGELSRRIYRSLKPVIVAFNGSAAGMGLTVPLAADIRIATKGAKMGFVFAARGIIPEACS
ncbi:MAG: enoyl-CoA hydratase, partial [Cellvibrionaceae bacterium]|nr:enoyl-CoA hydratase [Cellvibrionaceae bacterium]